MPRLHRLLSAPASATELSVPIRSNSCTHLLHACKDITITLHICDAVHALSAFTPQCPSSSPPPSCKPWRRHLTCALGQAADIGSMGTYDQENGTDSSGTTEAIQEPGRSTAGSHSSSQNRLFIGTEPMDSASATADLPSEDRVSIATKNDKLSLCLTYGV